jgi:tetratricopeptide (TPR) repeat protein
VEESLKLPRLSGFRNLASVRGLCLAVLVALLGLGSYAGWHYARAHYLEPRAHRQAAERALEHRDFPTALAELRQCVEAWPRDVATRFLLARTARRAGLLDEAEDQLALCRRLQEETGDKTTGDTALEWELLQAQAGNLAAVESGLRARIREEDPDTMFILETLSGALIQNNRLQEARECVDLWLERRPDDFLAHVRRASLAEHLLDPLGAVDHLTRALGLDPTQDRLRFRLVELLLQVNRRPEAREHLQILRQRQPDNPAVLVQLAHCEWSDGNFTEARELLDEVLAKDPRHPQARRERGMLLARSGHDSDAEPLLREALKRNPADREALFHLAECLRRLGQKKEAKEFADELARRDARFKSLPDLMRTVLKRPQDPDLRYQVGVIFLEHGDTDDGVRWLNTALKRDPLHRPTHQALADYYERIGDRQQAAEHRRFLAH